MLKKLTYNSIKFVMFLVFSIAYAGHISSVCAIEVQAKSAVIVEVSTGKTLLDKNADTPMAPASMSKLMTLYLLFERLKDGSLSLDDSFRVSENAWRKGGAKSGSSTMFLLPGQNVKIEDLIRGIIVQSGNDACIVVAEGISGTEESFAEEMTVRGRAIGLLNSNFYNSTGWPHPDHLMTPRDLATLAAAIIDRFPEFYYYFRETEFSYGGIKQMNRNPLLYKNIDVDGLKTGHTLESGYGLTASALRGDRRVIVVVNGLHSRKQRSKEPERLLNWAFREFNNYSLFKSGEKVEEASVWLGTAPSVPLVVKDDVKLTFKRKFRREMKVKLVYQSPISTPLTKGTEVGKIIITIPGQSNLEVPVLAGADVDQLGLLGRLLSAFSALLFGVAGA